MEIIKFKLAEGAYPLERKHAGDAGLDIRSIEDVVVPSMQRRTIHTGVYIQLPTGYMCDVRSRSGTAMKNGVFVLNSPGTIDSGYRGEVQVIIMNLSEVPFEIKKGDRIAQLVPQQIPQVVLKQVDELDLAEDGRNAAGFGSTGVA